MLANWLFPLMAVLATDAACESPLCTCAPRTTVEAAVSESDAVFVGTVTRVRNGTLPMEDFRWPVKVYTFRVRSSWKGVATESVQVVTGRGDGDCGVRFRVGADYLVYADASNLASPSLATGLCSRTRLRAEAAADVTALGAPERSWAR